MSPKNIMVKCPQCERIYIDWHVSAITEQDTPATVCSKCGHRTLFKELSDVNGVLEKVKAA
ncbi:MAG: hypothetical protein AAF171_09675 [Cyanobacteria bacterium P01_A01_bin.116]